MHIQPFRHIAEFHTKLLVAHKLNDHVKLSGSTDQQFTGSTGCDFGENR